MERPSPSNLRHRFPVMGKPRVCVSSHWSGQGPHPHRPSPNCPGLQRKATCLCGCSVLTGLAAARERSRGSRHPALLLLVTRGCLQPLCWAEPVKQFKAWEECWKTKLLRDGIQTPAPSLQHGHLSKPDPFLEPSTQPMKRGGRIRPESQS